MIKDKKIYVFSGVFFVEISEEGVGKVMKIKDYWKGLEDDIDVVVIRGFDGMMYFFKGSK